MAIAALVLLHTAAIPSYHHLLPEAPERLRYSMQVKPPNSEARIIPREMVFPSGFQVKFLIDGASGGYLYMANQGPDQGSGPLWTWLYPSVPNGSALKPGATATTNYFNVDAMQGKEFVFLIWSNAPIPAFDKIIDSFLKRKSGGSLDAAEATVVQDVITRSSEAETEQGQNATIVRGRAPVLVDLASRRMLMGKASGLRSAAPSMSPSSLTRMCGSASSPHAKVFFTSSIATSTPTGPPVSRN